MLLRWAFRMWLFCFWMMPEQWVTFCAMPLFVVKANCKQYVHCTGIGTLDVVGAISDWLDLEIVADAQKTRFKTDTVN